VVRVSTGAPHRRTLWEEGRHPARLVVVAAVALLVAVIALDLLVFGRLGLPFDVVFVLACAAAALAVRPRDFFVVGVLPPLLLAVVVVVLAITARGVVADRHDVLPQAVVSGLAHHSGALVAGYALTLVVLALRQVALRHSGVLRSSVAPGVRDRSAPPAGASR
jgi:mannose/fructose/N-acetylgalactosamine-specific phosphotransferase system component IIC